MTEENPTSKEKKIQLKPRKLKAVQTDEESGEVEAEKKNITRLAALAQPTGVPFDARAQSRPRPSGKDPDDDPALEKKATLAESPEESNVPPAASSGNKAEARPLPAVQPVFKLKKWIRKTLVGRVMLGRTLLALIPVAAVMAWIFFSLGASSQRRQILAEIAKQGVNIPADFQTRLNKALMDLRTGDAGKALDQLTRLEQESPAVSSLTYLVALAAMQAGDPATASAKAEQSLAKRERVSDSLALKAVLETQKPRGSATTFGDPRLRAESYLRQAMIADAANPSPYVELATLLRYRKQDEEAMQLLQGARSRLNPVDSHTVVDASIALLKLQNLPDDELPENINPDNDAASLFSASYVAMR
ncbi:MAG: hypothetical protein M0Q93_11675, partial [Terrimicrobiaceae bacterium]|nr:hypothetical protein [Terrimicrobiaceae bacterium]